MVPEEAQITFYKIQKCGYYLYGRDEAAFGCCAELLNDLAGWAKGKSLKQTKIYEANDEVLPSYLLDIKHNDDNYVLLLWNEVPSINQNVTSLKEDTKFGTEPTVIMNEIKEGSIPGFATYFWFVPSKNLVASIKLNQTLTGQKTMQCYLHNFLRQSSCHVVAESKELDDGNYEVVIKGYNANPEDKTLTGKKYYPQFVTRLVKNRGRHDIIRRNAANVSKIEKVVELDTTRAEELALWQRMLINMKISHPQTSAASAKVRYELSPAVSLKDIDNMIADWEKYSDTNSCDYAFVFKGDSKTYRLSSSLARTKFQLDLKRQNDEFVTSESLLKALVGKRELIFREAGV